MSPSPDHRGTSDTNQPQHNFIFISQSALTCLVVILHSPLPQGHLRLMRILVIQIYTLGFVCITHVSSNYVLPFFFFLTLKRLNS